MKEATSELNATVIIVIIVAALVVFFYFTVWPLIRNNLNQTTACSKAICPISNRSADGKSVECYLMDDQGQKSDPFTCVWKG